jgi:hypothetical protein
VLLLVAAAPAAAQVKLAWNFRKGEKFYQETSTTLKQVTRIRGQENLQEQEHVTVTSFTVKERNQDGSVVLEQRIESIKIGGKTEVSGTAERLLRAMEGSTFTLTLSSDLRITSFEGYDELVQRVAGDDPAALKVVQTLLSRETLQSMTEEAFAFLPREAVRPGKSWERKLTASLGPIGSVIGTQTYTYEGPTTLGERPVQKILMDAKLSYRPPQADPGLLPFQVRSGELRVQSGRGHLWFDDKLGRLVQSEMTMHIKGSLSLSSQGQEFTLELDQDQTVKIRITDEPPAVR